jgi:adenylosuccinate synthase
VAYKINGRIVTEMPASLTAMRNVIPLYETLPGWGEFTDGMKDKIKVGGYEQLPETIKNYIIFIEKQVNCPITFVSYGADRNETITKS